MNKNKDIQSLGMSRSQFGRMTENMRKIKWIKYNSFFCNSIPCFAIQEEHMPKIFYGSTIKADGFLKHLRAFEGLCYLKLRTVLFKGFKVFKGCTIC